MGGTLRFSLIGLAAVAWTVPCRATPPPDHVALAWTAPAGCPSEDAVRSRALELAKGAGAVDARAEVTRAPAGVGYHLELRLKTLASPVVEAERSLDAESCDALAESAAVIVAMSALAAPASIPTSSTEAPPPVAPAPAPPPPAAVREASPLRAIEPATPRAVDSSARASAAGDRVRVAPVGALDVGTLPRAAFGAGLAASVALFRGAAAGIAGAFWSDQNGALATNAAQGAHFQLSTLQAFASYPVARSGKWLEASARALVEVASMQARGVGADHVQSTTAAWVSVGAGGIVRVALAPHVGMILMADAVIPTRGQSFVIDGAGTVHHVASVAARVALGPEVRF